MKIDVKGHSGCDINIVEYDGELVIEKSTSDSGYIPRLREQAYKQQEASATKYQHIRIPEIYSVEESDEELKVRMEYVYSKNFVDYFEDSGFEQIRYFIHALELFVDSEISSLPIGKVSKSVMTSKMADVSRRVSENVSISDDAEVKEIIRKSEMIFSARLDEEMRMPLGRCHGDLTFSNILFNGNNYYLIDFLDSFVESPLIDIVKIRQDSCFGWSQLMFDGEYDKVRLDIVNRKIDSVIDNYYSKYDWYTRYYRYFQLMNFLRVLQYAHEDRVISYLKRTLTNLTDEF